MSDSTLPLPPDVLAHVRRLDEGWARLLRGERPPSPLQRTRRADLPATDAEFDLVYAGGGLGLLHAWAMAQQPGIDPARLLVFDRRATGETHREWNISRPELEVLLQAGIFIEEELNEVIAREYERGFIRFHNPSGPPVSFDLPGVLDLAIDSGALLSLARRKLEAAGATIWDGVTFEQAWLATDGPPRAVLRLREPSGATCHVGARLLINALGALSPLSLALAGERPPLDGVCPTVGTVARGFAPGEIDPTVGEILVTREGTREGRQLIWEGFPAAGSHFTTYLFYYDVTAGRADQPHSLEALFHDYFALLPTYKRPGPDFAHLKPVYGFIPARHHLDGSAAEQARVARGLLSVGDAAARQNPLTFTGFGSFVRHLPAAASRLAVAFQAGELEAETLSTLGAGQSNLSAMWVMARFLAPHGGTDDVNSILRDFTLALREAGAKQASRFFLDRAEWGEYVEIMLRTARHRPQVFLEAFEVLGTRGVARWLEDLVRWKQAERRSDH